LGGEDAEGLSGDSEFEEMVCDRFNFFGGGCSSACGVVVVAGGER
jgi:hypothetical protein